MGKYVYVNGDTGTDASATFNGFQLYTIKAGDSTIKVPMVMSTHCLAGDHDYGYSDKCDCFCHSMKRQ